jgi:hypothetical protein
VEARSTGDRVSVSTLQLRPGQLWGWMFNFNNGWWPAFRVCTEGRGQQPPAFMLSRGDMLTVITPDDIGPYEFPVFDDVGYIIPRHRWHIFLIKNTLVWIRHDWLDVCELIVDVA